MNSKRILSKLLCLKESTLSLAREMKKLRAQVGAKEKRRIIQKQIRRPNQTPIFILEAIKVEEEVIAIDVEEAVDVEVAVAIDVDVAIDEEAFAAEEEAFAFEEEAFAFEEAIDAQPMPVLLEERIKKKRENIYVCIVIYIAICNVLYICS
jgi:hypothetical protein